VKYVALPTEDLSALWSGGNDTYGNKAERIMSDGNGNPCRHCLRDVPKGAPMLIVAYRPFLGLHPYAETGPIFLCGAPCERGGGISPPDVIRTSPDYLLKGYSPDERIVYGTGAVVRTDEITDQVNKIFAEPRVSHIHVRSARNNCYLLRIDQD